MRGEFFWCEGTCGDDLTLSREDDENELILSVTYMGRHTTSVFLSPDMVRDVRDQLTKWLERSR